MNNFAIRYVRFQTTKLLTTCFNIRKNFNKVECDFLIDFLSLIKVNYDAIIGSKITESGSKDPHATDVNQ